MNPPLHSSSPKDTALNLRRVACALDPLEHELLGKISRLLVPLELISQSPHPMTPAEIQELLANVPPLGDIRTTLGRVVGLVGRLTQDGRNPAAIQPQPLGALLDRTLESKPSRWSEQMTFAVDVPGEILIQLTAREFDDIVYPLLDVLGTNLLRQSSPHPSLTIRADRLDAGPTCMHFDHTLALPVPDGKLALQTYAERLGIVDDFLKQCGASASQRRLDTERTRLTLCFPFSPP